LYFPSPDPLVGTLQAFGIYAVGFVSRPVGAALFGHYGDRIGRKVTLIATLLLTGRSTLYSVRYGLRAAGSPDRRVLPTPVAL
jgi:MFS family permease